MIVIYVFAVYVVSVCSSDLCKNFDPLPFKFAHFSNKLTYDVFSTDEPSKCNLNEFKEVKDLTKLWVPVNDSSIGGPYYNFAWFVTYLGDNPVAPEGYYGSAFVDEKTGLIHVFYLKGGDSGEVDADYEIWRVFYAADSVHAIYVCDSLVEENATPQFVYVTNTKKTLDSDTLAAIKSRMGDLGLDLTLKVIDQSDCSETLDYALKCPAPDSPADICFDDYEHTHGEN